MGIRRGENGVDLRGLRERREIDGGASLGEAGGTPKHPEVAEGMTWCLEHRKETKSNWLLQ